VTDLRAVLEESEHDRPTASSAEEDEHHTFLVLDRHVQSFPWESLPALRSRSISRIPSLAFLTDRLHLAKHLAPTPPRSKTASPASDFSFPIDVASGFFVLNPSGDLKKTQEQFEPWIAKMKALGWEGIVGRAPSEGELLQALGSKDLVVFVSAFFTLTSLLQHHGLTP
jgi:separase